MNDLDNSINVSLLKDQIYKKIKTEIISGKLVPGTRLSVLELAKSMNVSCSPVREAINMLSKDGLIMMNPRKQPIVKDVSFKDEQIITELRMMLEPYAAKKSIRNITGDQLDQLNKMLKEVLSDPANFEKYTESDLKVHQLIYNNTGFELLKEMLNMLKDHSMRIRYIPEQNTKIMKEIITSITKEHQNILNKLHQGNEDEVAEAVLKHLQNYSLRMNQKDQ